LPPTIMKMKKFGIVENLGLKVEKAGQLLIESKQMSWHIDQLKAHMTALVDFLNRSLDLSFDPDDSPEGEQQLFKEMRLRYYKAIMRACERGDDRAINKILEEPVFPAGRDHISKPLTRKYFSETQKMILVYRQLLNGTIYWTDVKICPWEKCSKFFYKGEKGKSSARKFCSSKCQKDFNNQSKNPEYDRVYDKIHKAFEDERNRLYLKSPDEAPDSSINKAQVNIKKWYEEDLEKYKIDITNWGREPKKGIKHGKGKR